MGSCPMIKGVINPVNDLLGNFFWGGVSFNTAERDLSHLINKLIFGGWQWTLGWVGYDRGIFNINQEFMLESGMANTRRPKLKAGTESRGLLASSKVRLDLCECLACLGRKRWYFLPALMAACSLTVTWQQERKWNECALGFSSYPCSSVYTRNSPPWLSEEEPNTIWAFTVKRWWWAIRRPVTVLRRY